MSAINANFNPYSQVGVILKFNKYSYEKHENDNLRNVAAFASSSAGSYKIFKFASKLLKSITIFAQRYNLNPEIIFKTSLAQKNFSFLTRALIIPKMPSSILGFRNSIKFFEKEQKEIDIKKRDAAIEKIFETIVDSCFLLQFGELVNLYSLGAFRSLFHITGYIFLMGFSALNAKMNAEYLNQNINFNNVAKNSSSSRIRTIGVETKRLTMLQLAKNVASAAMAVIVLLDLLFKVAVISEVATLAISTATILLSVWGHFYKETLTYQAR